MLTRRDWVNTLVIALVFGWPWAIGAFVIVRGAMRGLARLTGMP